jgi:hypothetical protein
MNQKMIDSAPVFRQWNDCHSAFFRLRYEDFRWHQEKQDWLEYFTAEFGGANMLFAQATPKGVEAGISAKTLWLSVWGNVSQHSDSVLEYASELTKKMQKTRLHLGGEEFHFVPGIPAEDKALNLSAEKLGFQFSEAADFSGSLNSEMLKKYIEESLGSDHLRGWELQALTEDKFDSFSQYMKSEFPGRWAREFGFWREKNNFDRAFWNFLLNEKKEIKGFSRLAIRGKNLDSWIPGALRFPLFPEGGDTHTDACLGPIGISASERGKGAGKILLALSLQKLLMRGADRVSIDWTNAYNYYIPLGLKVVRNYRSAWRDF